MNKQSETLNLQNEERNNRNISLLDFEFTKMEVLDRIKALKNNKQAGLDMIPNEFIKFSNPVVLDLLVGFFNKILSSGSFPDEWNISLISTIHKSGDVNDCNNYRGISICSCICKLFTSLLQKRLQTFLDDNNILNDFQAGFRPDYRTTDHLFTLKTLINKYVYKNNTPIYAAFIDFSKAFDSVWRPGLYKKLLNLGIGGNFYRVLKSMYSSTKFAIKKNGLISQTK